MIRSLDAAALLLMVPLARAMLLILRNLCVSQPSLSESNVQTVKARKRQTKGAGQRDSYGMYKSGHVHTRLFKNKQQSAWVHTAGCKSTPKLPKTSRKK